MLTDEATIRQIVKNDAPTARRIVSYLKNLLQKPKGKEPTIERAIDLYSRALKQAAQEAQEKGRKNSLTLPSREQYQQQTGGLTLPSRQQTAAGKQKTESRLELPSRKQYSAEESIQDRIDRAKEMLDNNAPSSQIFKETGLVALTDGQLQDGFGGEIVGRYTRGRDNEGRILQGGEIPDTGDNRGRIRGRLENDSEGTSIRAWSGLGKETRAGIVREFETRLRRTGPEGDSFFSESDRPRKWQKGSTTKFGIMEALRRKRSMKDTCRI